MNLEARIEALEARQRERDAASEPRFWLCPRPDASGFVIRCARYTVQPGDGLAAMVNTMNSVPELLSRDTCGYDDECPRRAICRASLPA